MMITCSVELLGAFMAFTDTCPLSPLYRLFNWGIIIVINIIIYDGDDEICDDDDGDDSLLYRL